MSKTQLVFANNRARSLSFRPNASKASARGACPACFARSLYVRGRACRVSSDGQSFEAIAVAQCCRAEIGIIRHQPDRVKGAVLCVERKKRRN